MSIDQANRLLLQRFEQLLLKKAAVEKGLPVRFGVKGIRQRKKLEAIDEFAEIKRLFHEQIDEAVPELINLIDGGADLGGPQRDQLQISAGQFADLFGKPLDAFVFRPLNRGQGSQHPGHLMKALKEVAHRPVKNPAQAGKCLYRQRGLAVFDLGQLPLGKAGLIGQNYGRDPGCQPQFADPGTDPSLNAFFQFLRLLRFAFHPLTGSRFLQPGARSASPGP